MHTPPQIVDTHCHLDIPVFAKDLDEILQRARTAGVSDFVLPGYIATNWPRLLTLCRDHSFLHCAPGLHPNYLASHNENDLERLGEICRQEKIVAIGEIGLDFFYNTENETKQRKLFEAQLDLAQKHALPILVHARKSHDLVASILRRKNFSNGGIIHAFNGSRQQAEKYIDLGFKLGYGGTLTWSRAKRIRSLAASLPLSAIVLETDAPDIPLAGSLEKRNSPEFLPKILEELKNLRTESLEEIASQTTLNAQNILRLSK